jgi:hypothetical protein
MEAGAANNDETRHSTQLCKPSWKGETGEISP